MEEEKVAQIAKRCSEVCRAQSANAHPLPPLATLLGGCPANYVTDCGLVGKKVGRRTAVILHLKLS